MTGSRAAQPSSIGTCLPGGTVQRPRLCGETTALVALREARIIAVTVANNHALDAGEVGLAEEAEALRRYKVVVLGVEASRAGKATAAALGPVTVITANLSRPAWPPGRDVPIASPDELATVVRAAHVRDASRPVLVILHGGREMDPEAGSFERGYAIAAVHAGAAAVVFHGSHAVH